MAKTVGADRIMWGSDYPHPDSTYPSSREWIARATAKLDAADADRIFGLNVAELYGVDIARLMAGRKQAAAA